jgi:hypothetical protein
MVVKQTVKVRPAIELDGRGGIYSGKVEVIEIKWGRGRMLVLIEVIDLEGGWNKWDLLAGTLKCSSVAEIVIGLIPPDRGR